MANIPARYPIPSRPHRVEDVVQRSRFITAVAHAPDPEAAQAFLEDLRREFPDATHHCWAFVAGPPGSTTSVGMSDDGEPHGTAGRPMLNVLLHSGVGEIVAVCVRYFGGTKLGTGGLTRAYSGGVKRVLEGMPIRERVERIDLEVVVEYGAVEALHRLLREMEGEVESEDFQEDVSVRIALPKENEEGFTEALAGITRGRGTVRPR